MAKLKNYNGRYCECDFENAFVQFLEAEGWEYLPGDKIGRTTRREVLIEEDLTSFLKLSHPDYVCEDIEQIVSNVRLIGGESDFATLHKAYKWMVDGMLFTPQNGSAEIVGLINFEKPEANIFKVVNQLVVDYVNNGETKNRRPDVMLYINGIPVCVIELKNPADENATIEHAFLQITERYWRDLPHLLHYCPLACISDGVKTRLGTVRTPYEHFYSWRRIDNDDKISTSSFDELQAMIKGVYAPTRLLEILRDYIIFRDDKYDSEESEIVCRYPQFFASRLLRESIKESVLSHSGKGGTYFGATGCGKTYTMAMLARQLSLRCSDVLGSPTIIMIVDRDDLQKQGLKLFSKCAEYLCLGEVVTVKSRKQLRSELSARESGGFYLCTIQKFCDRQDDAIGLINNRSNIICFSDEAHRTQLEHSKEIKFSKDTEVNLKAMISKPYAKVLREALPNATFVGFTGTPIAETYQTFGDEIDRYTMDQAVADGLTVPIKYHPRIARVFFDDNQVKLIEQYYSQCADKGATEDDITASKKAMSSLEVILGEDGRLERLCNDIHDHFTTACNNDPERVQKAMVVCCNRNVAYRLLKKFESNYPEWFELRKSPEGVKVPEEEYKKLKEMPTIAMVSSVGSNDPAEMYNYLGGVKNDKRSEELDIAFKQDNSNFRIVIVVDMWITGFDVPSLTYLYNDKPLQKHTLIQTISRVNRKYSGKEYGLIIDYIGIRGKMLEAMKVYGGGTESLAPTEDDVRQATEVFREYLEIIKKLFRKFDLSSFYKAGLSDAERYILLAKAAEYVFSSNEELKLENSNKKGPVKVVFMKYFLQMVKRMKSAYDICQPSGVLGDEEEALAQSLMAVAGFVRKMSGTTDLDTESMNRHVSQMVEEALKYSKVENILDEREEENIYSEDFISRLQFVKAPATKLELLIKLLKKNITDYGNTNKVAAKMFREMLQATIDAYHDRKKKLEAEEAGETQETAATEIINEATRQALSILDQMKADRESFRKMGLTFEEKAFYDILIKLRDDYNFEFGTDKPQDGIIVNDKSKNLAKKIKEIIDTKSSYADFLNNQNVRDKLKLEIKICLVKNGYPPQYSPEVFKQVMEQVENYSENND